MTELFEKARKFVEESFQGNKPQMLHFDRTVYWLQQLKPDADEAFLIAAVGHDIERVKYLISKHEVGGDDDQNLLKDADSLSFVENNADFFISRLDKLGYEKIKEKFDWMFNRITDQKAKEIAKPFYENMIYQLETAVKSK